MSLRSNIEKSKTKEECDPKTIIDPHEELFEPHEEISDESEHTGKATPFVYMLVIAVCVGGFLAGYDTGGRLLKMCMDVAHVLRLFYSHFGCFNAAPARFQYE